MTITGVHSTTLDICMAGRRFVAVCEREGLDAATVDAGGDSVAGRWKKALALSIVDWIIAGGPGRENGRPHP